MHTEAFRILFLEAEPGHGLAFQLHMAGFSRKSIEVGVICSPEEVQTLKPDQFDLVVVDALGEPSLKRALMERVKARMGTLPMLDLSESSDANIASGTSVSLDDYFTKIPINPAAMVRCASHALIRRGLEGKIEDLERRLSASEVTDRQTGLLKRERFEDRLKEEFRKWQRYGNNLSVALFEVYEFDRLSDKYGYDMADKVAEGMGRIVAEFKRDTDVAGVVTPGRVCIAFTSVNLAEAQIGIERTVQRIEGHVYHTRSSEAFTVRVCAGAIEVGSRHKDIETVFGSLRAALAKARERGPGETELDYADFDPKAGSEWEL